MTNIEKIRDLLGNAGLARGEAFDFLDHADKEFYEAARKMLPALVAVVEAAKRLDDAPTAKQQDAAEVEIRDALAALEAVEL